MTRPPSFDQSVSLEQAPQRETLRDIFAVPGRRPGLLSDWDLRAAIDSGELGIDPFDPNLVQPSSIDVRLGDGFREQDPLLSLTPIDPTAPWTQRTVEIAVGEGGQYAMEAGPLVLGTTLETVTVGPGLAVLVNGKSSLGRLGLVIHSTAGVVDPGFTGQITLELSVTGKRPFVLRPGMLIGQLMVLRLTSPAARPYGTPGLGSHYQGQSGPVGSRAGQEGS